MKKVDARGMLCPKPLMMTRKALQEIREDESLVILIDNQVSADNVSRYLTEHGLKPQAVNEGGVTRIVVAATQGVIVDESDEPISCPTSSTGRHVVVVKNRLMGSGSPELGEILMKAFVNTLPEVDPLPGAIVFYNSGIDWALRNSDVIDALTELSDRGVKILVCGTCLEFYGKTDQLAVGHISNMYEIAETMSRGDSVVYP